MVSLTLISGSLLDTERRASVFGGAVIIFKQPQGLPALGERVRAWAREYLDDADPETAHERCDRGEYLQRVSALQRRVTNGPEVREEFRRVLEGVGVDLTETGHSRFTLRVQPPTESHIDRNTATLGVHRDSWYSQNYAQCNWWTPWFPLARGRALHIYPRYWSKPLKNSSEGWSLEAFRAAFSCRFDPPTASSGNRSKKERR